MHRPNSQLLRAGLAAAIILAAPGMSGADAQEIPTPEASPPEAPVRGGPSPSGAFLRAVVMPGWGHASIGSYHRAGFYFAAEAATIFGLVKTRNRLNEALDRFDLRANWLRDQAALEEIYEKEAFEAFLAEDEELEDLRLLIDARQQQREDWVAFGIFLLFLSGADAFVSAHLQDFPAPIEVEAGPTEDGRMEVGLRLELPR